MNDQPMTLEEAAKTLLKYASFWRERSTTGYGTVYECACCRHAMNAGAGEHAPDCVVNRAIDVVSALP